MIYHDRAEMLGHTLKRHRTAIVDYFGSRRDLRFSSQWGSLKVLRWERRRGYQPKTEKAMALLAYHGYTDCLKELRADRWQWDSRTYTSAIEGGHLSTITWLRTTDLNITGLNLCKYIRDADTLKYFIETAPDKVPLDKMLRHAVYRGLCDVVRYLIENTRVMDLVSEHVVIGSACVGSAIEIVKYLIGRGFPLPKRPTRMSLTVGHWLVINDYLN